METKRYCVDCGKELVSLTAARCRPCTSKYHGTLHKEEPIGQKFWAKIDRNGPIVSYVGTPCWIWQGARDTHGYGQLRINRALTLVHRFSYELHYGPILENMAVCHSCDTRLCINPAHLWLGTKGDNVRDMEKKGRAYHPRGENSGARKKPETRARGERQGSAKLTNKSVIEIRESHPKITYNQLAGQYHVSRTTIVRIVKRESWKHI